MKEIILASKSPRRKDLMKLLNIDFKVETKSITEVIDKNLSIDEALIKLANQKAMAIFKENQDAIVIGADSIVYQNNKILNKPKSKDEAFKMIKSYSNAHHRVITAVSIVSLEKTVSFTSLCTVYFNQIFDSEILAYLALNDYQDKAGAYGIQGYMARHIKKVEGDYNAVVGFPVAKVYQALKNDFNIYNK